MKIDNADQSLSEKTDEVDNYEEEPGPIQNSNDITHSPENEDSVDEEEETD